MSLRRIGLRVVAWIEGALDRVKYRFKGTVIAYRPLKIVVFRGHGTHDRLRLRGRVLEEDGIRPPSATDSLWRNVWSMFKRFDSDEVPDVPLRVRVAGREILTRTNREGYFSCEVEPRAGLGGSELWHRVEVISRSERFGFARGEGELLVPPLDAEFGVISDIDDTILKTGATRLFGMLRLTAFQNARTRAPFEGVAAFYQALHRGPRRSSRNPIFYVSRSPWNLYDFLVDFMSHREIPQGPLYLRELGVEKKKFIASPGEFHKLDGIRQIMSIHADLPFVLIGDSGQDDPEVYRDAAHEFPGRVAAIYIRDVAVAGRAKALKRIVDHLAADGVEMVVAADTVPAAEHAVRRGLIHPSMLDAVRVGRSRDEAVPGKLERLLGGEDDRVPTEKARR